MPYNVPGMRSSFRLWLLFAVMVSAAAAADKQILLLAGKPSHPPGEHEHNAGVLLIAKWLISVPGIRATTSLNDAWPPDSVFDKADAIFFFVDGGEGHLGFQDNHGEVLSKAAKRG